MLSQAAPMTPVATTVRNETPIGSDNATDHASSTPAKAAAYGGLLEHFPSSLHDEIAQTLPELDQLAAFHQGFIERQCPLTAISVAHELTGVRDHRMAKEERARIQYLADYQNDDHVKARDVYGATLLHHAILNEDPGLARALLAKANVDSGAIIQPKMRARDWTRIGYAVNSLPPSAGNAQVQQAIVGALKRRDHPGGRTACAFAGHNGDNPLTFALTRRASESMITLLVDHYAAHAPAMLSAPDANGIPPLLAAVASGRHDLVRLLLKQTAVDINGTNNQGRTAVMECVVSGDAGMLTLLLGYKPRLDVRDTQGRTAQELASSCGATRAYATLVQASLLADPTARDAIGEQIVRDFHTAAAVGSAAMLKALLAGFREWINADVIASALGLAVRTPGQSDIAALLLDPAQTGLATGDVACIGLELAAVDAPTFDIVARAIYPADAGSISAEPLGALMQQAASLGLVRWVNYALSGDIDLDRVDAGQDASHGSRLLMTLLSGDDTAMLQALLQTGAPLQSWLAADNDSADAALIIAAEQGKARAFDLVLQSCQLAPNNDPMLTQRRLALAARAGSASSCQLILQKTNIVLPLTATRRLNPLMQAVIYGHHHVQAFLLSQGMHGCLKYKSKFKSAIEKALTMKDAKAVATILTHDRHQATDLPPLMASLLDIASANTDIASHELLVRAMTRFERSPKKLRECAEQAIEIGCGASLALLLAAPTLRGATELEREALFRRAISLPVPSTDIIVQLLRAEGHPRSDTGSDDEYVNMLDVESSGTRRLVNALVAEDVADELKLFWMGTILSMSHLDTHFVAMRDTTIHKWGKLVAPLAKSMQGDASYAVALGMAAAMAVLAGRPGPVCDILFNVSSRVLDVNIDLMPAADAILKSKRLDLLQFLPEHIQYKLQSKYKTQLGMRYTH